ncbi:MAG: tyrosine-type recombinase/integrase [Acidobacteriota bacterium]
MKNINKEIEEFRQFLEGRGLSEHTIRAFTNDLKQFFSFTKRIERESIERWLSSMNGKGWTNRTKQRKLTSFSVYLKWKGIHIELPKVKAELKLPQVLSESEASALLSASLKTRNPERDRLFIKLLLTAGLRISEALNLKVKDIEEEGSEFYLRINQGKGKKDRRVPIVSDELLERLADYIKDKSPEDNLFPLSSREAGYIISRIAKKAKINKNVSPHTLRHTSATLYLKKGVNLEAVRKILGHVSLSTTQRYLQLTDEDVARELKKAINKR